MLPRDRAEQILALHQAGWTVRSIADHLGHSTATIRGYLNGSRTPGVPAPRASMLTDPLVRYCRQRFADDPHLRPSTLFAEATELGFPGSRATFYRELAQHRLPPRNQQTGPQPDGSQITAGAYRVERIPALPRRLAPVTGETLASFLARLAQTNHLTLPEVLASLPAWFTTKTGHRDDRAQHHMLAPTTTQALHALAQMTGATPAGLARALPAFGAADAAEPVRATTACRLCAARRGIHRAEPIPVHLPAHRRVCIRHGLWLSDLGQPQLDINACPEIITAQHQTNRLLRRYTPQQLTLAWQTAITSIPPLPASSAAIPLHWRYRLLVLQTNNHRLDIPQDQDTYTQAAIYPDAINRAAALLCTGQGQSAPQGGQPTITKVPFQAADGP